MNHRKSIWTMFAANLSGVNPNLSSKRQQDISTALHQPEEIIKSVSLRTDDAQRLSSFYTRYLGLKAEPDPGSRHKVLLKNTANRTIVRIFEDKSAKFPPQEAPGLFHIAYNVSKKSHWQKLVGHLIRGGVPYFGASDHRVSWAAYFLDPDGNGIEITLDKPRKLWPWRGDQIQMSSHDLDFDTLPYEPNTDPTPLHIGHVHLSLKDTSEAYEYRDALGMRITQRNYPGAIFMANGNYHHHIAINNWGRKSSCKLADNYTGITDIDLHHNYKSNSTWTDKIGINFNFHTL